MSKHIYIWSLFFLFTSCSLTVVKGEFGTLSPHELKPAVYKVSKEIKKYEECATLLLYFIPIKFSNHTERINNFVRKENALAVANAKIKMNLYFNPFYMSSCTEVEGQLVRKSK